MTGSTVEAIARALSDSRLNGALWALVAAIGFAFLQVSNRKANQVLDAYRTAFGFLVAVEVVLLVRFALLGDLGLLLSAPLSAVVIFGVTTLFHFVGGWTLLALSQQTIGVARTGALVSSAPIIGTLVAAVALDEPLTLAIAGGVLLAVVGVALISLSGRVSGSDEWRRPWFGLAVALIWGSTPLLIRIGLERFDQPVAGLTIGLASSVVVYALLLTVTGRWRGPVPATAVRWIAVRWCLRGDRGVITMAVVRSHHHRHSDHRPTDVGALRHGPGTDHVPPAVRAHEPAVLRRSDPGANGRHHRSAVLGDDG